MAPISDGHGLDPVSANIGELTGLMKGLTTGIEALGKRVDKGFHDVHARIDEQAKDVSVMAAQRGKIVNLVAGMKSRLDHADRETGGELRRISTEVSRLRNEGCNAAPKACDTPAPAPDDDDPHLFKLLKRGTVRAVELTVVGVILVVLAKLSGIHTQNITPAVPTVKASTK